VQSKERGVTGEIAGSAGPTRRSRDDDDHGAATYNWLRDWFFDRGFNSPAFGKPAGVLFLRVTYSSRTFMSPSHKGKKGRLKKCSNRRDEIGRRHLNSHQPLRGGVKAIAGVPERSSRMSQRCPCAFGRGSLTHSSSFWAATAYLRGRRTRGENPRQFWCVTIFHDGLRQPVQGKTRHLRRSA